MIYAIGKINKDIYQCIVEDIITDEVIIKKIKTEKE